MGEAQPKLTALQLETLKLIASGEVRQLNCGYAAWRIMGGSPNAVGRLVAMGLASWGALDGDRMPCVATGKGLGVLATPASKDSRHG